MSVSVSTKFHYSVQKFFTSRKSKKPGQKGKEIFKPDLKRLTPSRSSEKLNLLLQPQIFSYSKPQENQMLIKFKTETIDRGKSSFPDIITQLDKKKTLGKTPEIDRKIYPKAFQSPAPIPKASLTSKIQIETMIRPLLTPYESWKASNNIKSKVFILAGNYPDIRKALIQRGWVENEDQESPFFDLKWSRNARIPLNLLDWQLYNHFPRNFELSVKFQLYENLKKPDRSSNFTHLHFLPRSYKLDIKGFDEFFENFKSIFAISMLKSYLESQSGHILEKIMVALIVCRRYITEIEKENYKNNRVSSLVMNIEWKILTSTDLQEIRLSYSRLMLGNNSDLLANVSSALTDLQEKDPQFFISGKKNIWIVKAGRKSRGRDIALFNNIDSLKAFTGTSSCWVVQKYIENPLLISNKKFDIRQWVLVSSSDPLTIWIYKQCYLRFSIEDYSDERIDDPFIHLTNNSISKKSNKFDSARFEGCMWSLQQFQEFLIRETGNDTWSLAIYPMIKKIVKQSLINVGNLGRSNSFEIFGYDFMIDERMKPWLLEINSSPAMDYSTVSDK